MHSFTKHSLNKKIATLFLDLKKAYTITINVHAVFIGNQLYFKYCICININQT